jgi:hypothetical protein
MSERILNRRLCLGFDVDLVRYWIQQCLEKHKGTCYRSALSKVLPTEALPTRVLDVGNRRSPILKLVQGSKHQGRYMTLSHCWGKETFLVTMKANLQNHQVSIPPNGLSQTFKGAICITRQLRIKYLWIDSLCIVQDDFHDWASEAKSMGTVYMNSFLNIAPTSSADGRGGCLFARPGHGKIHLSSTVGIHREVGRFTNLVDAGILYTRGWVVQERCLSPRTLHCISAQLFGSVVVVNMQKTDRQWSTHSTSSILR